MPSGNERSLLHVVGEACFVAMLAAIEWTPRERLSTGAKGVQSNGSRFVIPTCPERAEIHNAHSFFLRRISSV